jgi:hypothetical protein
LPLGDGGGRRSETGRNFTTVVPHGPLILGNQES